MHFYFAEVLEPEGEAEERFIAFFHTEIGNGRGAELAVVLGYTAVH